MGVDRCLCYLIQSPFNLLYAQTQFANGADKLFHIIIIIVVGFCQANLA